jgi:hypothetical protein
VTLKGLSFLLEAGQAGTEHDVTLTVIGRPKPGGRAAEAIERLGLADAITWVSGVPDERIVELYAEATLAVVPSLYEGFSLPAVEAMATGTCLVATTGGALPEVTGLDNETVLSCPAGDAGALAHTIARGLTDADLRARIGAAGRQRVIERWSWRHCAQLTVDQYPRSWPCPRTRPSWRLGAPDPASGAADAHRPLRAAGVAQGDLLLDLGCGFGRRARRPSGRVVAFDYAGAELKEVRNTFGAMAEAARSDRTRWPAPCRATAPACRSRTASSTG